MKFIWIVQEEGWVVCRAFKKPIPNSKPSGYEAWNNNNNHCSYYVRDNNNNNNSSYTTTLNASNNTPIHHHSPVINPTFNHQIGTNFPQFPFSPPHLNPGGGGGYDQINNQQLVELPQLDSPTVSTKDGAAAAATASEDPEDAVDKNSYGGGGDYNWKDLDYKMIAPPPQGVMINDHPVLPSYSFANMPLLIPDDDRNHFSHLLECFPDL
nr:NAC domain-containing protein 30-like [Ipomoea batatas]